jgi:hypothetical protein
MKYKVLSDMDCWFDAVAVNFTEIDNDAVEIEKKLFEFEEKVDNNKLTNIGQEITQALNSVEAARVIIQNLFL